MLKPQDVVIALKIATFSGGTWEIGELAESLGLGAPGVEEGVQRALASGLLADAGRRAVHSALREFLVHGMKYAFPAVRGRITKGIPTAANAEPLRERLAATSEPMLVWADRDGGAKGESLAPLHDCVTFASRRDPKLYALLAVADALRTGTARERELAVEALDQLLAS